LLGKTDSYETIIPPEVEKQIKKLDRRTQKRVHDRIKDIERDPYSYEQLSGILGKYWECHVGGRSSNLLVIYRINDTKIPIITVGTHKELKKLERYLRSIK